MQQGLPLRAERSAAGQFWTFTMSNSKTQTSESLVEAAKLRFTMRAQNLKTRSSFKHACVSVHAHIDARVDGARSCAHRSPVRAHMRAPVCPPCLHSSFTRAYLRARVCNFVRSRAHDARRPARDRGTDSARASVGRARCALRPAAFVRQNARSTVRFSDVWW